MSVGPDDGLGTVWPSPEVFAELAAERRVIPVVRRLLADSETPLTVYRKLANDEVGTFLLESAETGVWGRYSFIGAGARAMLTSDGSHVRWLGEPPLDVPTDVDPLQALEQTLRMLYTPALPGLPTFTGGFVGAMAYDVVRLWERVPDTNPDEIGCPDVMLALASDVAVMDHRDGTILLIANAINGDGSPERAQEAYADACARLDRMTARLAAPAVSTVAVTTSDPDPAYRERITPQEYMDMVRHGQRAVVDGDVFQVVLSQRFEMDCPVDALEVYRCLRVTNPSPYLYLFRGVEPGPGGSRIDIVGSSPEALVRVEDGRVVSHPIAGSRPRGRKPEEDHELGEDLLRDPKERAEHLMLVDLARNDLSRVCNPGTVSVVEFMAVERYSHIMHLVSTVTGDMRPGRSAVDVFRAAFPAGTLSGAPKPRALELIEELEPVRRGIYGGVVGYFDFAGNMDQAIAIRTAVIKGGKAYIQAGAGIVHESVPRSEDAESRTKAAAVIRAVATARALVTVNPQGVS